MNVTKISWSEATLINYYYNHHHQQQQQQQGHDATLLSTVNYN
jgi:hypothetical protein